MQWDKENEFKVETQGDDKEVTLGPTVLTAIGLGLLVLCCICFLAGYAMGHRAEALKSSSTTASSSGHSIAELLARNQAMHPASGSTTRAARTEPDEIAGSLSPAAAAQEPAHPRADTAPDSEAPSQKPPNLQPAVHTALPQYTSQAGSWVVQVAAVENSADADVLVSALHQHGYSVSARRGAGDNLIHVQVGPYASRSDADSMRQKLLNDGYNANIEP
ncbi:SPOR domain-containing protein [Terracidiphilus gabretensis]|uniref:SPOR domain-containing protein n=1 Tax=Terracidiphilus gabretensis TaxID=1577687 RepID=UPI00071B40AB|nr:SPOR domain-containing protein [Terracidiphilus gabretensis]